MEKEFHIDNIPEDFFEPKILVKTNNLSTFYVDYIINQKHEEFNSLYSEKIMKNFHIHLKNILHFSKNHKPNLFNLEVRFASYSKELDFAKFFMVYGYDFFKLFFIDTHFVEKAIKKVQLELVDELEFLSEEEYKKIILEELKNYLKELED